MDAEPVRVSAAAERNAPGSTPELSSVSETEGVPAANKDNTQRTSREG